MVAQKKRVKSYKKSGLWNLSTLMSFLGVNVWVAVVNVWCLLGGGRSECVGGSGAWHCTQKGEMLTIGLH